MKNTLPLKGLTVSLLALLVMPAAADVLCRKGSGVVVARPETCKRKEVALDLSQFGAAGPKGDKGDAGGFRLLNGAGQSVAQFDIVDGIAVASPVDGKLLELYPDSDGVSDNMFGMLFHASANCDGPLLAREFDPKTLVRNALVRNGKVYYAGDPIASQTYMSSESIESTCTDPNFITSRGLCCNPTNSGTDSLGPVQSFDVSELGLGAGPFTIVSP